MARSKIIFGKTNEDRHVLDVEGDPETVKGTLKNGWAQLNRAREGEDPEWVWVNESQVLYVEPASEPRTGRASF